MVTVHKFTVAVEETDAVRVTIIGNTKGNLRIVLDRFCQLRQVTADGFGGLSVEPRVELTVQVSSVRQQLLHGTHASSVHGVVGDADSGVADQVHVKSLVHVVEVDLLEVVLFNESFSLDFFVTWYTGRDCVGDQIFHGGHVCRNGWTAKLRLKLVAVVAGRVVAGGDYYTEVSAGFYYTKTHHWSGDEIGRNQACNSVLT